MDSYSLGSSYIDQLPLEVHIYMDAAISFSDGGIVHRHPLSTTSMSSSSLSAPAPHAHTCVVAGQHNKQQQQLGPGGGRAGKRRSRASKRAPTTYISTDPANFRIMVQQVTGAHQPDHDTLLHPEAYAAAGMNPLLPDAAGADEASAALSHAREHQLQQQPCFPTLDSWNVMYESTTTHLL